MSSGETMPARAPASIDMLQTVSRPSIDIVAIARPAYSIAWPVAPPVPILAMIARIKSFAATFAPSAPSTVMRSVRGLLCHSVCVASTCDTSVAPMPKASAPKAPCVEVWLSPHTISMPGCVKPSSGPMTCTMPWRGSPRPNMVTPASFVLRARSSTMPRRSGSAMASRLRPASVGT